MFVGSFSFVLWTRSGGFKFFFGTTHPLPHPYIHNMVQNQRHNFLAPPLPCLRTTHFPPFPPSFPLFAPLFCILLCYPRSPSFSLFFSLMITYVALALTMDPCSIHAACTLCNAQCSQTGRMASTECAPGETGSVVLSLLSGLWSVVCGPQTIPSTLSDASSKGVLVPSIVDPQIDACNRQCDICDGAVLNHDVTAINGDSAICFVDTL